MTQEKLKQFLDACFDAKRLIEKLPDLPDGMKPRQVHVLDAVNEIQKKQRDLPRHGGALFFPVRTGSAV